MKSRATSESPKMFDNTFVDAFSRTHVLVVPLVYLPATAVLVWYSMVSAEVSGAATALLALLGFGTWTLAEYWLHRTFFHWTPNVWFGARMHFIVHGVHHQWPNDRYRLVMPPAVSGALFCGFLFLYWIVLGRYAWAFHAGYVVGYTYYDVMHFYIHHGRPKSRYFKHLRRHHMVHHFKTSNARYGVSWTIWDRVFGTLMDQQSCGGTVGLQEPADTTEASPRHLNQEQCR